MRSVFTLSTQAPTLVAATAILTMQMCGPGVRQQTSASLANDMRRKGQPLLDEIIVAKTRKLYIINFDKFRRYIEYVCNRMCIQ